MNRNQGKGVFAQCWKERMIQDEKSIAEVCHEQQLLFSLA